MPPPPPPPPTQYKATYANQSTTGLHGMELSFFVTVIRMQSYISLLSWMLALVMKKWCEEKVGYLGKQVGVTVSG